MDHFPVLGLRLVTPRLQMVLPNTQQLSALAAVAADGVHDPEIMPFIKAWTGRPPAERARSVITHHWATLGAISPSAWTLPFTVIADGIVVGQQSISGKHFSVTRECSTGSWLGRRFHGNGFGTEMRAAVIHLAFAGLDADTVVSAALSDNPASLGVSRKLGYKADGVSRHEVQGELRVSQRLRLNRSAWEHRENQIPVQIHGLADARSMLDTAQK